LHTQLIGIIQIPNRSIKCLPDQIKGRQFLQAGRSKLRSLQGTAQVGQTGKDILSVPLGNNPSSEASTPQEARNQELKQTDITQPIVTNSTVSIQSAPPSESIAVSGTWSLELNDSTLRNTALTLFQNGDAVYGTGNINLDANTTMTAAASGTVTGDKANLDIVSLGKVSLYRVSMTVSGDSATGSYTAYRPGASPISGTVTGIRSPTSLKHDL
jgi:hypothetical protein